MAIGKRYSASLSALAAAATALLLAPGALAAGATVSPLPRSDYTVQDACGAPPSGHAACMAVQLVPRSTAARARTHPLGVTRAIADTAPSPAAGDFGLRPQDVHSAYELPEDASSAQTIALVDAYNDPNAESDLEAYSAEFGLPACGSGNGCFKQVNESGETASLPFPRTVSELESARKGDAEERAEAELATGWDLEISLDIETAHGTCQSCRILLVEASSSSYSDLEAAERSAAQLGASEISNSWGGPEVDETTSQDSSSAFNDPGVVITASAGDDGYLSWGAENADERGYANYPASSPHVVAVGGTRLSLGPSGEWEGESVWNGSGAGGGGCSVVFSAQPWQREVAGFSAVGCETKRAVADVSADADPYTGLAIHDTSSTCEFRYEEAKVKHVMHWCTVGGTSLSSPLIASVFALAGGAGGVAYPSQTLYENAVKEPTSVHDVVTGSNGECGRPFEQTTGLSGCTAIEEGASCDAKAICLAGTGYDGPTGLGTPAGTAAFQATGAASRGEEPEEEEGTGSAKEPVWKPPIGGFRGGNGGATGGLTTVAGTGAVAPITVQLSDLALTTKALLALDRRRPRRAAVSFSFVINMATRVQAKLSRRMRRHRRLLWHTLATAMRTVGAGSNSGHFAGRSVLAPGVYRLTLSPSGGSASSISFRLG